MSFYFGKFYHYSFECRLSPIAPCRNSDFMSDFLTLFHLFSHIFCLFMLHSGKFLQICLQGYWLILSVCILWINLSIEFLISITVFLICRSSIYFLLTPTWHPVYTLLHSGSEIKTSFLSLFESLLSGSVFPAMKQGVQFLSDCALGVPVDVVVCVVDWVRFLLNKGYETDFQTTGPGRLHAPVEFKSVILHLDL